jgi:hypothetical protein
MMGILLCHLEEIALLASLRPMKAADVPPLLREPLRDVLPVRQLYRDIDLGGDICSLVVVALDEGLGKLGLGDIKALSRMNSTERIVLPSRTTKTQAHEIVSSR